MEQNHSESEDNGPRFTPNTVRVNVWKGNPENSHQSLIERTEPNVYELSPIDVQSPSLAPEEMRALLNDNPNKNYVYGFRVQNESRPATLNVCTNKSESKSRGWNPPIGQGVHFRTPDQNQPYTCTLWGQVMMYVSPLTI